MSDTPEARPVSAPRPGLVEMYAALCNRGSSAGYEFTDAFLARLREADALAKRYARLYGYARHFTTCVLGTPCDQPDAPEVCDCGLAELLKEGA